MYVVNASPHKDGNTVQLIQKFLQGQDYQQLDLIDVLIAPYGYELPNDEFQSVFETLAQADAIVFASPIYWYDIAGNLKVLLDRFADLEYPVKELRRKKVYVLLQGSQPSQEVAAIDYLFNRFCRTYGMSYKGLAVTNYELKDIEGWEVEQLQKILEKSMN